VQKPLLEPAQAVEVEAKTMPEPDQAKGDADQSQKANRYSLRAAYAKSKFLPVGLRRIFGAAFIIIFALTSVAIFLPNMTERVKFFTGSTLNVLILLVVAVQAYIYRRQWEAMNKSLIMERAYVGINDIGVNLAKKRLFIKIENTGSLPADSIQVYVGVDTIFNEKPCPPETYDYGRFKLFKGTFKIQIVIPLERRLSDEDIAFVKDDADVFIVKGYIDYRDGINKETQRTEFSLRYSPAENMWIPRFIGEREPDNASNTRDAEKNPN
jgi:hypothetical protein